MTFLDDFVDWMGEIAEEFRVDLVNMPAGIVPEDIGELRRAKTVEITALDETGFTLEIKFPQPAGSSFPYPAYLNEVDIIRPTQAGVKALRWIDSRTGQPRFATSIFNVHKGWFDRIYWSWLIDQVNNIDRYSA